MTADPVAAPAKIAVSIGHANWRPLSLDLIPPQFHSQAVKAADRGDAGGFLLCVNNMLGPRLLFENTGALQDRGIYEDALLSALRRPRVNLHHVPFELLCLMVKLADRTRLRAVGDPLPGPGPFVLYRGVSGNGAARRIRGLSWTDSLKVARWFARRLGLPGPAVFRAVVPADSVLAYMNDRKEQEFLVLLPPELKLNRVDPDLEQDEQVEVAGSSENSA
jgi:hypothetical protein